MQVGAGPARRVVLDSDAREFGGHGRVDPACEYPLDAEGFLKLYTPSRSGLVFAKAGG